VLESLTKTKQTPSAITVDGVFFSSSRWSLVVLTNGH
jgi:hypothetical protein